MDDFARRVRDAHENAVKTMRVNLEHLRRLQSLALDRGDLRRAEDVGRLIETFEARLSRLLTDEEDGDEVPPLG